MGCWGMGMTQTDEFCEIYDKFMDFYNNGKAVSEISSAILAEYHAEFDDNDGVMHDVYFALAKAEWMCCEQSELILSRVREIIESDANIKFYRELGATEKDLKIRRNNLEKFWISLQSPRSKPRQRRIDPLDRVKPLPPFEIGECYRYKYESGYRVFIITGLDKNKPGRKDLVRCAIIAKTYSLTELATTDFYNEPIYSIAWYIAHDLLAPSATKLVKKISVPDWHNMKPFKTNRAKWGDKKNFRMPLSDYSGPTLAELYSNDDEHKCDSTSLWSEVKCGDIFAYHADNCYRVFALLHKKTVLSLNAIYCYAWRKHFEGIPQLQDLKNEYIIPLGWFVVQFYPSKTKLTYIGNDSSLSALSDIDPALLYKKWKPATMAAVREITLTEDYPEELCEIFNEVIQAATKYKSNGQ